MTGASDGSATSAAGVGKLQESIFPGLMVGEELIVICAKDSPTKSSVIMAKSKVFMSRNLYGLKRTKYCFAPKCFYFK